MRVGRADQLGDTPDSSRVQHHSSSDEGDRQNRSTFSAAIASHGHHEISSFRHEVPVAALRDARPPLREQILERWKRVGMAGFLSAALLFCITGFLGRFGSSMVDEGPPAAGILAQSRLFLGKTTSLAPAAHAAQAMWKKTVGDFYGDQLISNQHALQTPAQHVRVNFGHGSEQDTNPFGVSDQDELHGELLPSAKAEEDNWNMKLQSMQQDELQSNRDVMNNVILLHSHPVHSTDPADVDAELRARRTSARAEQKTGALERLAMLATNPSTQTNPTQHQQQLANSVTSPATTEQQQEAFVAAVPQQQQVAVQHHAAAVEAQKPVAAPVPTATVTAPASQRQQAAAATAVAQHPQVVKHHGSTDEESRSALNDFFSELAHRDEQKTVLHIAKYKKATAVAPPPPQQQPSAQVEDSRRVLKEVVKVEQQMEWLKDNMHRLSSLLEHPAQGAPQAHTLATSGTSKAAAPALVGAAQRAVKQQAKSTPLNVAPLHVTPPAGCPIWPAQGEVLPSHCPHQLSALRGEGGGLAAKLALTPRMSARMDRSASSAEGRRGAGE
eukprot:CAMPEP_0181294274 /NCGR_PEP_ID=MMETSP1101-20121128/3509_1 /TAXON_ID=46948 /ORGANISM="Rhodomonas abbreviata, Strain Caron Lab Isolate" /LENGTH=555 /DNA_ID=CAMNT_0023398913 /DNA_START=15 /DNA_END=1680 /DNA_ORIENTATION=+